MALSGVQRIALSHELNNLNKQKDELEYIQDIYNAYVDTKSQYDDVTKMNGKTETVSDALADAIEEMEEKFPSGVKVKALPVMEREFPWTLKYQQRKKQQRSCRILQPSMLSAV